MCADYSGASFRFLARLTVRSNPGTLQRNTQETGSEGGKAGKAAMFVINRSDLPSALGAKKKPSRLIHLTAFQTMLSSINLTRVRGCWRVHPS